MTDQEATQETLRLDLRISEDELSFLLRALGIGALPGYKPSDSFDETRAQAALNSLLARQFVQQTDDYLEIDQTIAALVGGGATTQRVLTVLKDTRAERSNHWFYLIPQFTIYHSSPDAGVHRFQTVPTGMELIVRLNDIIDLDLTDNQVVNIAPYLVDKRLYDDAITYLNANNPQAAMMLLEDHNVPEVYANSIVNYEQRTIIMLVQSQEENTVGAPLLVIKAEDGFVTVLPEDEGTMLLFSIKTGQAVLDEVAELMG
ncbi:MAG: hypothetical protein RLP44_10330 [Aggregatilineales bacterium]